MPEAAHYPVLYRELLEGLMPGDAQVVLDCTLGMGSLAEKIAGGMSAESLYIGIDKDAQSLALARQRLHHFGPRVQCVKNDFVQLDAVLNSFGKSAADVIIFDLGISTYQLAHPQRGFSIAVDGPLDMRMDQDAFISAYDLVNNLSEKELADIFWKFGEERYARRIAAAITAERMREPIATTARLAEIITRAMPSKSFMYRIHPATRSFQALRIAANRELETLRAALDKAVSCLAQGGRIGVISFHSLEDRIVKHAFRDYQNLGLLHIVTKKPIVPGEQEIEENNPSRSAKLRIGERV